MGNEIQGNNIQRHNRYYQGVGETHVKLGNAKSNEPLLKFKNYDENGKLSSVDYYKDFNGDGEITSDELYRVDKYARADDGSRKVESYVDENNDGKVDRTKTYNYDSSGNKTGVTKGPEAKATIDHVADGISDGSNLVPVTDAKNDKRETVDKCYKDLINGKLSGETYKFDKVRSESDGSVTYRMKELRRTDKKNRVVIVEAEEVNIKKNADGTTTILTTSFFGPECGKYENTIIVDTKTGIILYEENLDEENTYDDPKFGGYQVHDKKTGNTLHTD